MTVEPFTRLTAVAAPLPRDNVDTDALFPGRFIADMDVDYHRALFGDWRWDADGTPRPDFVLNRLPWREARILVAGRNFGCGSSREHAVWALTANGVRCVVAESFGDIFAANAVQNGLLCVPLPAREIALLTAELEAAPGMTMTVDLTEQTLTTPAGRRVSFAVDPATREALLSGLDAIGRTMLSADAIDRFQVRDRAARPWVWRPGAGAP
ncbi:MAG: 3-isopropylmalate dehydratase small subunit [Caenispirillum sp.]|nr:3-isopropylmalate dehydratase small subunit [Caenispirillum sp.]